MKRTAAILKRELFSLFASPMGYIILAAFVFVVGFYFNYFLEYIMTLMKDNPGGVYYSQLLFTDRVYFTMMVVMLLIAPAITMRTIAEEKNTGTIQLLLTSPVRDVEVVLGKFGAAFVFFLALATVSLVLPLILSFSVSSLNWGKILSSYIGLVLLCGVFCASGLLISSLVENQVVAAVLTLAFLVFGMWILGLSGGMFEGRIGSVLVYLSLSAHFVPFTRGVVSTQDILYFLSTTFLMLFLTVKSIEKRKWGNLLEDDDSRALFSFDPVLAGALFAWALFFIMFAFMPRFDLISMIVLCFGTFLAMIWVLRKHKLIHLLLKSKKGLAGANVILITLIVCLVYTVLNFANFQFYKSWDLTFDRIQSLSDETRGIIDRMGVDVEITVYRSRNSFSAPLADLLQWYDHYSSKITVTYLDPLTARKNVKDYADALGQSSLQEYITVRNMERPLEASRLIHLGNMTLPALEEEIDLKLLSIDEAASGVAKKKVYFLTGHLEPGIGDSSDKGLSDFAKMLEREYIEYTDLYIPGIKKIPGDCDLLIIPGPKFGLQEDTEIKKSLFTDEEIQVISEYLSVKRKNILVFAGPDFSRVPFDVIEQMTIKDKGKINTAQFINRKGLLGLLAEEGFLLTNGILFHGKKFVSGDKSMILMNPVKGNAVTQQKEYRIMVPGATPLIMVGVEGVSLSPFISSPEYTWVENLDKVDGKYDEKKELYYRSGVVGAVSFVRSREGMTDRRIAVIGSSLFPTNAYIGTMDNKQLLRDTVNWLLSKENFSITRNYRTVDISISETAKNAVFYVSVLVLPFMFLGVAVLVWWDRR